MTETQNCQCQTENVIMMIMMRDDLLTSAMRDDIGDTYDTSVIIYVFYGTVHVCEVSWYKPINDRSTVTMISTIISY